MGILNSTPDSFSDGGDFVNPNTAISHARQMKDNGADILDIGAESSGPGSKEVPEKQEWERLKNILPEVIKLGIPVSVDTWKPEIAERALSLGTKIINDVTAFRGNPDIIHILKDSDCQIIIMHSKDQSARTTIRSVEYNNPIQEIGDFLEERLSFAQKKGIDPKRIILDPGMGNFLSSDPHVSFRVIRELSELKKRFPENRILLGTSRKGFLGSISDPKNPKNRTMASVISALIAAQNGADILRVHDVKETKEAVKCLRQIQDS